MCTCIVRACVRARQGLGFVMWVAVVPGWISLWGYDTHLLPFQLPSINGNKLFSSLEINAFLGSWYLDLLGTLHCIFVILAIGYNLNQRLFIVYTSYYLTKIYEKI